VFDAVDRTNRAVSESSQLRAQNVVRTPMRLLANHAGIFTAAQAGRKARRVGFARKHKPEHVATPIVPRSAESGAT
jgi:hypothetical protein